MGYYTDYYFYDILDKETQQSVEETIMPQLKALAKFLNSAIDPPETFDNTILAHRWWEILQLMDENYLNAKWYDETANMKEFSTHFPELVFILCGDGDENGDVWQSAYSNGRCNTAYVEDPVADTVTFRKDR